MNLMAVSLATVIVVLIAVKIKELDSGYGIVLSIAGCVMLMYFVVSRFRLIASYIDRLTAYVSVNISYIDVILKMIGIAYICRFSSDICKDAGLQCHGIPGGDGGKDNSYFAQYAHTHGSYRSGGDHS